MPDKRLILIDGMALVYRSFFAIRSLSTRAGTPTNAVFGFVRKLDQLRQRYSPTHWAVAFDGGVPEERTQLVPDYKAQRPSMPDDMRGQLPLLDRYLECAGIARFLMDRQEADDVIASIAVWARPEAEVLIASSDKDLYQLIDDGTAMLPLASKAERMGVEAVKEKTGVPPDRIVDWLALTGDSSDNIAGVPGVGAKTAARLISEYGSVDELYADLSRVGSDRLRSALAENREIVARNVRMVTLNTALPTGVDWGSLEVREPDVARLVALFDELEFHAMARALREPELL